MATRSTRQKARGRRLLVGILLVALLAGLVGSFLSSYEVLEKGQLLPYSEGKIYKVRFGGGLTLYVEPELKPSLDLLNSFLLTGVGFIALTFAVILAASGEGTGSRFWFFVVGFLGSSYLVADETLGLHETIGHNLPFLAGLPLVERPDDVVVVLFALPAAAFLFLFRTVILASRAASALFAVSLLVFLAAAAADLLDLPGEEAAEVLVTICLAAAMLLLGLHHLRRGSGPGTA